MKSDTKKSLLYAFGMMSYNMEYMLVANLTYALTESYGMSAITTGAIFLFSRFFDGFTDILAGLAIDKTSTKLGKARIYDLLHLPLWICLVLVFSVPDIGMTGKIIWVFVFYNLLQAVIATFMNVAEPLRLSYSFEADQRMKVMAVTSGMAILITYINAILTPVLIAKFEDQPHGWTIIMLIYAIPFAAFGLLRFALLPEENGGAEKISTRPPKLKESLYAIFHNKYILLYAGVMACWAMYNTMGEGSRNYFFTHVYGNITAATITAAPGFLVVLLLLVLPKLIDRLGKTKTLQIMLFLSGMLCLSRLLGTHNLVWMSVTTVGATAGVLCLSFMKPLLTIDCINYGKKNICDNVEAAYSTANSLADKMGLGIGSILLGAILEAGGYDGTLALQPASAVNTITMLYSLVPAILMFIPALLLIFYDLDKKNMERK